MMNVRFVLIFIFVWNDLYKHWCSDLNMFEMIELLFSQVIFVCFHNRISITHIFILFISYTWFVHEIIWVEKFWIDNLRAFFEIEKLSFDHNNVCNFWHLCAVMIIISLPHIVCGVKNSNLKRMVVWHNLQLV